MTYTLFEQIPVCYGTNYRQIVTRESLSDLLEIFTVIQKSNINFECYAIFDSKGENYDYLLQKKKRKKCILT